MYKEIVTKAIIGKGKKYYKNTYTVDTENIPTTVLGCWVINHKFKGSEVSGKIVIDGSFDVNINAQGTETGVDYTVKLDEINNKPENLYFMVGDTECRTIAQLETALAGHFDADDTEKSVTKTVRWIWDYETKNNGKTDEENNLQDT